MKTKTYEAYGLFEEVRLGRQLRPRQMKRTGFSREARLD